MGDFKPFVPHKNRNDKMTDNNHAEIYEDDEIEIKTLMPHKKGNESGQPIKIKKYPAKRERLGNGSKKSGNIMEQIVNSLSNATYHTIMGIIGILIVMSDMLRDYLKKYISDTSEVSYS